MKPTLANLKKRPALWVRDDNFCEPRITYPNGSADFFYKNAAFEDVWALDFGVPWHGFALKHYTFVSWL